MFERPRASRVTRAGTAAAALLAAAAVAGPASADPSEPGQGPAVLTAAPALASKAPTAVGKSAGTLTLITGDEVTLSPDGRHYSVTAGPGRSGIRFVSLPSPGGLLVVPTDALPLLTSGRIDSRLFDIRLLQQFGYQKRRDLPLIVAAQGSPGASTARTARAALRTAVTAPGRTVDRDLPALNAVATRVDRSRLGDLWRSLTGAPNRLRTTASKVWLDGLRRPSLDVSVPQIGAPAAWKAGFDGTGVTVALLDSGVDSSHQDLVGQVVARQNFTGGAEDDLDHVGHGTHVASTIVGTGAASGGKYRGVAPGAKLLDGKVCVVEGCPESAILDGMQWAVDRKAAIVSMSLGGTDTPGQDPVKQAVGTLTAASGTLFVVAAGNEGEMGDGTVSSPSTAEAALSVAAVDSHDEVAPFSSRGPSADGGLKPDIAAPGVAITAARSSSATDLPVVDGAYTTMSGTSMATPHVSGAAAILKQQHPTWTAAQLKATLMASANPRSAAGAYAQGAGRVDVAAAIGQTVTTQPASVDFGRQSFPHTDDTPITREVTYLNAGTKDVTLALTLHTVGPDGKPAPTGMFTLHTASVTVPAGGKATASLTVDSRVGTVDGLFSGWLTGTAANLSVRTPFGVDREKETYTLTLRHLDRTGAQATVGYTTVVRTDLPGDQPPLLRVYPRGEDLALRLPRGRYAVVGQVVTGTGDSPSDQLSLLVRPDVDLAANQTVTLDARQARPVSVTVPSRDARPVLSSVHASVRAGSLDLDFTADGVGFTGISSAQVGPNRSVPGFVSGVTDVETRGGRDGAARSPYVYHLAYYRAGTMLTGFSHRVAPAELATVTTTWGTAGGADADQVAWPSVPGLIDVGGAPAVPLQLPQVQTGYFSTGGVQWLRQLETGPWGGLQLQLGTSQRYQAGKRYAERWNTPVFGPSLGAQQFPYEYLSRQGDDLVLMPSLFSDSTGHYAYSDMTTAKMTLTRNGTPVFQDVEGRGIDLTVPPATARYRFTISGIRAPDLRLTTGITASWTFVSGHVPGDSYQRLPISTVRFSPALSPQGTVKAGSTLTIPVTVQGQAGARVPKNRSLTVQVSFDDGRSWTALPVRIDHGTAVVQVHNPGRTGFVSLRATATDVTGGSAEVSIIRAYQLTR